MFTTVFVPITSCTTFTTLLFVGLAEYNVYKCIFSNYYLYNIFYIYIFSTRYKRCYDTILNKKRFSNNTRIFTNNFIKIFKKFYKMIYILMKLLNLLNTKLTVVVILLNNKNMVGYYVYLSKIIKIWLDIMFILVK